MYALHSDCRLAADLNWKEGTCMNEATTYDIVIHIFGFAFACFSLGYALGKDIGTKNDRPRLTNCAVILTNQ